MIFGTFDGVHEGHRFVFKEAKKHGDHLFAVVALDKTVRTVKGRGSLYNEKWRLREILREEDIDDAVLGNTGDKYKVLNIHQPDVVCLGYDQKNFIDRLRDKLNEFGLHQTRIIRLEPYEPEKYKSSIINNGKQNNI